MLRLQCQDIIAHPDEMCAVHGRKAVMSVCGDDRSSYVKVERVPVSVILYLTCLGIFVSTPPSLTSACSSAMTAVCIPESFQFLQSRSYVLQGLEDRQSPLRVSGNSGKYVEFACKSALSSICYTEEGSVHLDMLFLLPSLTAWGHGREPQ